MDPREAATIHKSLIIFDKLKPIQQDAYHVLMDLIHLATNAITAYSAKPLILVFRLGVFGMLIAALLIAQAIYSWFTKASISGWTSLTLVIVFFGSANLLGLGILGIYLSQVFNEIKQRPGFLISERLGSNEVQLGT